MIFPRLSFRPDGSDHSPKMPSTRYNQIAKEQLATFTAAFPSTGTRNVPVDQKAVNEQKKIFIFSR